MSCQPFLLIGITDIVLLYGHFVHILLILMMYNIHITNVIKFCTFSPTHSCWLTKYFILWLIVTMPLMSNYVQNMYTPSTRHFSIYPSTPAICNKKKLYVCFPVEFFECLMLPSFLTWTTLQNTCYVGVGCWKEYTSYFNCWQWSYILIRAFGSMVFWNS